MEAKDLKAIIEQVLQEMNVSSDEKTTAAVAAATEAAKTETTAAAEGAATEAAASGVDTSAWKDKTVTCIVPYDAGGGTDTVMRALADAAKGSFKNISVF